MAGSIPVHRPVLVGLDGQDNIDQGRDGETFRLSIEPYPVRSVGLSQTASEQVLLEFPSRLRP